MSEIVVYPQVEVGQLVRQIDLMRHNGKFYSHSGDGITERFCDMPTMTFKKEPINALQDPRWSLWRRIE